MTLKEADLSANVPSDLLYFCFGFFSENVLFRYKLLFITENVYVFQLENLNVFLSLHT